MEADRAAVRLRPRIFRPGEAPATPVLLACPLCGLELGAVVMIDPGLRQFAISVECNADGTHDYLTIHSQPERSVEEIDGESQRPSPAPQGPAASLSA